jgi:hypothetical protein
MNTKKLRQTTDLLGSQESSVATGQGKLKFPYHTNKIFTCNFWLRDFWNTLHHTILIISYFKTSSRTISDYLNNFSLKLSTEI